MKRECFVVSVVLLVAVAILLVPVFGYSVGSVKELKGVVKDSGGEPLAGVVVKVVKVEKDVLSGSKEIKKEEMLGYATTDRNGAFSIKQEIVAKINAAEGRAALVFSYMGYEERRIVLDEQGVKEVANIVLKEASLKLKEVVVRAPKVQMRGDTIVFNVESFAKSTDRALADVLKRIPGIEVDGGGNVKYNGEPINKFYIEGADLLGGMYGLATNNLNPKDIAKVEVLENHQPVKALKDVRFSDRAALNIKLKETAKAKWLGDISLSGNYELWNGRVFAMSIGKGVQSMNNIKTNNTGVVLRDEAASKLDLESISSSNNYSYELPNYTCEESMAIPNLGSMYTTFNKSILASTNNLRRFKNDYELKSNLCYSYDKQKAWKGSISDYYLKDNIIHNYNDIEMNGGVHKLTGDITLSANGSKRFLKNRLSAYLENSSQNDVFTGSYSAMQHTQNSEYYVENNFNLLSVFEHGKSLSFKSVNKYVSAIERLGVVNVIDKDGSVEAPFYQKLNINAFATYEEIEYKIAVSRWNFAISGSGEGVWRNMKEYGNLNKYVITATPYVQYRSDDLLMSVKIPVKYYKTWYDDTYISPFLYYFRWNISQKTELQLNASFGESPVSDKYAFEGYIYTNYRNVIRGSKVEASNKNSLVDARFSYRDPLALFYVNLSASYVHYSNGLISVRDFDGKIIATGFRKGDTKSKSYNASAEISKDVRAIGGKVGFTANYAVNSGNMVQNNNLFDYKSYSTTVTGSINAAISMWGSLDYSCSYTNLKMKQPDSYVGESSADYIKQSMTFSATPIRRLSLDLSADHYYNSATDTDKNIVLSNLYLQYMVAKKIELDASVNNIFNKKSFSNSSIGSLSFYLTNYRLRGREITVGIKYKF